jgi:hypothetical protein
MMEESYASYDSSDSFDPQSMDRVFVSDSHKLVYGGGEFGTVFVKRPIDQHKTDIYNFKIVKTTNMNIRIGLYKVVPKNINGVSSFEGKHFWCYNLQSGNKGQTEGNSPWEHFTRMNPT